MRDQLASGLTAHASRSRRGQSLVEFALILPMMLVILFGVVDFGRVFQAGITIEAASRNAAEIAAQEYVQLVRNKPGAVLDTSDYLRLHDTAIEAVCDESATLSRRPASATEAAPTCMHDDGSGPIGVWPRVAVCIHDGSDPICGQEAGPVPQCPRLAAEWDTANAGASPFGAPPLPYVEVRVCYEFATLFNLTDLDLPFGWSLSLGTIYLERDRSFTVACYQTAGGPCN